MASAGAKRFKIGEVCKKADVQPYVLRYWETEFPALSPGKSGGGQRVYTDREVEIILRIKKLLYSEGFTIAGAKKKLDAELAADNLGGEPDVEDGRSAGLSDRVTRRAIDETRHELREILKILDQ